MEDHNTANLLFEGVHETGPIMLWDRGTWEPHPESDDILSSLHRGVLRLTLHGEKLKGGWTLTRINSQKNAQRPIWTFCKEADSFAESCADKCVLKDRPNSVKAERTMEQIVRGWTKRDKHERQMGLFDEI
jgi:bifunctional non-homologous end joining protein LigD